ncbi:MAG: hypothetical protein MZV70_28825 [Desulfobacterales bacterium]|nr:hypothetical protein [Desulfobacterales bacterium]
MLIVLVALVSLVNLAARASCRRFSASPMSLQRVMGAVMAPVCWLMGVPWAEAGGRRGPDGHQDRF